MAETEEGLRQNADKSKPAHWTFFVEKADLLCRRPEYEAALRILAEEPPAGREFSAARAHRKLFQGWIYKARGNTALAEQLFDEGLAIAKSANDGEQIASLEYSKALLVSKLHRTAEAEELLRDGTRHTDAIHDRYLSAYGLQTLGQILMYQWRYEEAVAVLERAYSLSDPTGDAGLTALTNVGICLYRLGEYDRALTTLRHVGEIASQPDAGSLPSSMYGAMGNIFSEREDYAAALAYQRKALKLAERTEEKAERQTWLTNLAHTSILIGDWRSAESYNQQAVQLAKELKDKSLQLYSLCDSGEILFGRGDFTGAEKLLRQVARSETDENRYPLLRAHAALARLYAAQGRDALADREYQAAIGVVEDRRALLKQDEFKISFLSALISAHEQYIDFLMSHGRNERALEVAEANRARILQERQGDTRPSPYYSAAAYERLARESGSVLISYSLGRDRSYMWVTSGSGILSYPLPPKEQIRSLVEQYRAFVENVHDPLDTEETSGSELYKIVLKPAIEHIPPGAHVVIAPDQALHALNFETLPVPGPRKHYFIEDATITVAPSLNVLMGHPGCPIRAAKLLLIGDPNSSDEHFPKLPYAAKEISFVEGHFPAAEVTGYRDAAAVPAVYASSPLNVFSYIHFTAHASANLDHPLDSAIILSGQKGANKLTARDVLKHPLNAELVTISACQGAGAKAYAGEGLVGFMWAFFQTGAHNVVAGLWDVSDESTPQLMDGLYAGIAAGKPPAEALRSAKLALMKANSVWSLPYYWAPFQLYSREEPRRTAFGGVGTTRL
jgi:CHAT domain-containing protein